MVTRRILSLLESHSVLQPNHFVFLPGRGTASELIHIINVLEEVAENNLPVDLTTADVRGAFDSPERTAQWASWHRIGVSAPLATDLTNLGALFTYRLTFPFGMHQNMDPTLILLDDVNPQALVQAFLYPANKTTPTKVPQEFVEAIVQAFQQSPADRAVEADLIISLDTPFSFEEFLYALLFGGSSSPGESGVSYHLFQVAPLLVHYSCPVATGSADPHPQEAFQPAMMGKFRPIGLLEVLRKVWTGPKW
jgi:hypothetical protein